MTILSRNFFNRDTIQIAKELLGCKLVRTINNETFSGIIVETEAYTQDDPACHACRGRTPRTLTMYKQPGIAYVYFIYGMYHCLNFVTEEEETAGAVLIRALEPVPPLENTDGPGKLCREMDITRKLNEVDVTNPDSALIVKEFMEVPDENIVTATRIGIKKAADYPWRFYIKDNVYVSRPKATKLINK